MLFVFITVYIVIFVEINQYSVCRGIIAIRTSRRRKSYTVAAACCELFAAGSAVISVVSYVRWSRGNGIFLFSFYLRQQWSRMVIMR